MVGGGQRAESGDTADPEVGRAPSRVLFTGYAPVHFVCFKPLYERLAAMPGVDVRVSGGLRAKAQDGTTVYDEPGMYAAFELASDAVLAVEEMRQGEFDLLFCANTKRIEPRSFGRAVEIFHGMSFRNRAVRQENTSSDCYFMLGPYMRRAFERRGLLDPADPRAEDIGFPKTDPLLDGSLDREALMHEHGLSGERPVLLYAPTGARKNSLETTGEEAIRRLRATGEYDLLIKLHDHPKNKIDWFARLDRFEDDHTKLVRSPDVIPTLFIADLLITDASSVANEYTLLDRPMVFLDVPELIQAAEGLGSALDLRTWGRRGGSVVARASDVPAAVESALAHPERHATTRRAIASDLFYNPGRATEAALAWVCQELGVSQGSAVAIA